MRWTLPGFLFLAGCAGGPSTASTSRPATTPEGPAPCTANCEAPLETDPRFEPPGIEPPTPREGTDASVATCTSVGEVMASIDLGNYAEPDVLAPAVAKYAARCTELSLDQKTRTCIAEQADKASIAYCAPSLFPGDPVALIIEPGQCEGVIVAVNKTVSARPRTDHQRRWWETREMAFLASCRTDRWTNTFAECIKSTHPSYCTYNQVKPLTAALQAMLVKEDQKERDAKALWNQAYENPRKFPNVKLDLVSARGCADLIKAIDKRIDALQSKTHWQKQWWTPRSKLFRTSCLKDRWPRAFGDCARDSQPNQCYQFAPSSLWSKMQVIFQNQPVRPVKPPKPPKRR